jgi:hypothetical protein
MKRLTVFGLRLSALVWVFGSLLLTMTLFTIYGSSQLLRSLPAESSSAIDMYLESVAHKQQGLNLTIVGHRSSILAGGSSERKASNFSSPPPLLRILEQLRIKDETVREEFLKSVPSWSSIEALYGSTPRIYGLEHCQSFQQRQRRSLAAAGTFNSGTNLLATLLLTNCEIPGSNQTTRWQVPWYV